MRRVAPSRGRGLKQWCQRWKMDLDPSPLYVCLLSPPTACPCRQLLSASRQWLPPGAAGLPGDGAAASGGRRTASRRRFAAACPADSNGRCSWSRRTSDPRRDRVPAAGPRSPSAVGTGGRLPWGGESGSTGLSSGSKFPVPFLSAW